MTLALFTAAIAVSTYAASGRIGADSAINPTDVMKFGLIEVRNAFFATL